MLSSQIDHHLQHSNHDLVCCGHNDSDSDIQSCLHVLELVAVMYPHWQKRKSTQQWQMRVGGDELFEQMQTRVATQSA